ncbi:alpha/beta-hydrolase [Wilcoxina mikolae CBS 423.85]|nr:alpha/beta-hydrolase [Wilcoxina mikolae CBS 423.85]
MESAEYILRLVEEEQGLVGGGGKVVLGGASQGMATALVALLMGAGVDAFVGVSGWIPFVGVLQGKRLEVVREVLKERLGITVRGGRDELKIPVFLGHGTDDAWVSVELGKRARDVLTELGMEVTWREYEGAEEEGHWLKEPEEFDDIVKFLETVVSKPAVSPDA